MKITLALAAALLLVTAGTAQERAPQNDSIRRDDLRADLFFYASDAMRGRLVDTPENRIATEFLKSRFERLGLAPAAGMSFFQPFDLVSATLGAVNELEIATPDGATRRPVFQEDFSTARYSASAAARGEVVFAGYGIVWPEKQHDDLPADAIAGKIALVLTHEPGEDDASSPFNGLVTSEYSAGWRKALAAQQRGAIGVIFVDDAHNHERPTSIPAAARGAWPANPDARARSFTLASWVEQITIPVIQISRSVGESLVRPTGRTLVDLSTSADRPGGVLPVEIPSVEVRLTTSVSRPIVTTRNVVARVEGSDPGLRDEAVLVTAHLDHEGVEGDDVYNGADDNGSGTVALLEIAEAYALAARAGQRPRRSVVFAAFNAEERGLLGSWAYTERPPIPLDRTVGVINLDMIGRNEEIPSDGGPRFFGLPATPADANVRSLDLMGYSFAPELAAAIERVNAAGYGLTLKKRNDNNVSNLVRRTDHWPFLHRGVPAIALHSGLHPDYHMPTDDPGKINYEKLETVARLVHSVTWMLANQDDRPRQTASAAR